jgi:hypothetical protein
MHDILEDLEFVEGQGEVDKAAPWRPFRPIAASLDLPLTIDKPRARAGCGLSLKVAAD